MPHGEVVRACSLREELESDIVIEPHVLRAVNDAHAAVAERRNGAVAAGHELADAKARLALGGPFGNR